LAQLLRPLPTWVFCDRVEPDRKSGQVRYAAGRGSVICLIGTNQELRMTDIMSTTASCRTIDDTDNQRDVQPVFNHDEPGGNRRLVPAHEPVRRQPAADARCFSGLSGPGDPQRQ
jgi:hypothetical protein